MTVKMALRLIFLLAMCAVYKCDEIIKQPHILFVVLDDVGWNDISLHGSNQIMTPNLDMIGLEGIVIKNYYTDTYGTPSRSAMLTGKYPFRTGSQGVSIGMAEDRGLPVTERILPSYMQELGYDTHMVGKWLLGQSRKCFLPMERGFDTFYGCLGDVDYYTYNKVERCNGTDYFGLNFFNNSEAVLNQRGHLTDVLTEQAVNIILDHDPTIPMYLHVAHAAAHTGGGLVNLQAPPADVAANGHIAHSARRVYAGMVTGIDRSVGQMIAALDKAEMLNNTLIVVVCDNGAPSTGPHQNYGSNMPLRGTKGTPWEGAVRSTALVWHNDIKPGIWKGLFHVTDWMPTLLSVAGGSTTESIDGIDQWSAMINNEEPPRTEAIIALDDLSGWGAFRDGDFKLVVGNVEECYSQYYGKELNKLRHEEPLYEKALEESEAAAILIKARDGDLNISAAYKKRHACNFQKMKIYHDDTQLCIPTKGKGCLFNLSADPTETEDLWDTQMEVVKKMILRLRLSWQDLKPRCPRSFDKRANPTAPDYVWYPWLDSNAPEKEPFTKDSTFPMQVLKEEQQYYTELNLKIFKERLNDYLRSFADAFVESMGKLY